MTIKEIPSVPTPDHNLIKIYSIGGETENRFVAEEEYRDHVEAFKNRNFQLGVRMLKSTGAIEVADQLIAVLKDKYPDAGYGKRTEDGRLKRVDIPEFNKEDDGLLAEAMVVWNLKESGPGFHEEYWSSLNIGMRVLSEELVISGADMRVIPKELWIGEDGRAIIESSMCNAVINPIDIATHPIRV